MLFAFNQEERFLSMRIKSLGFGRERTVHPDAQELNNCLSAELAGCLDGSYDTGNGACLDLATKGNVLSRLAVETGGTC